MELITLPKMRVKELQTFAENCITICSSVQELKPALDQVKNVLATFIEGMLKDQASGKEKKEIDSKRDKLLAGLNKSARAELLFPYAQDATLALQKLLAALQKYGNNVYRMGYNEETAAIDNILQAIETIDLAPLKESGISRWIPLVKAANDEFKLASSKFVEGSVESANVSAASIIAPELSHALDGLITMLFAHCKISATENLLKTYSQIEELVHAAK